ncbi:hypothetical protein BF17_14200 [Yersinia similis]|uniref:Uncharacterized protein n=1 Tax=Yersinia similis TaxID=367190 RepID=A0ABN4CT52_9GAMM|nr:hypothetical protein BF17_14200 [Yersinia similis]
MKIFSTVSAVSGYCLFLHIKVELMVFPRQVRGFFCSKDTVNQKLAGGYFLSDWQVNDWWLIQ